MRYFNFVDLFTICLLLTAVASPVAARSSQLAFATDAPTLLANALPAPTIPCYFIYLLMTIYAL